VTACFAFMESSDDSSHIFVSFLYEPFSTVTGQMMKVEQFKLHVQLQGGERSASTSRSCCTAARVAATSARSSSTVSCRGIQRHQGYKFSLQGFKVLKEPPPSHADHPRSATGVHTLNVGVHQSWAARFATFRHHPTLKYSDTGLDTRPTS